MNVQELFFFFKHFPVMCWKSCSVILFQHSSIIWKHFDNNFRNLQLNFLSMLSDITLLFTRFGILVVVKVQLPTDGRSLYTPIPKCLSFNVNAG
jgi:hypothetical protein